ncbi:MAG: DUF503 domain-containing protein [Gammaproteobacteria bacterium]
MMQHYKREQNAYILFMSIELMVSASNSLKSKRRVIKSITERLRNKFNVSVAEMDYMDLWQRSLIGLTMVSNDKRLITRSADAIENFVREFHEVALLDITVEIF